MLEIRYQLEPADLEALTAFVHRGTPLWVVVLVVLFLAWHLAQPNRLR